MHGVFCRDHPDVRLHRQPGGRGWVHEDGEYCASSWPVYQSECGACRAHGRDIYELDRAQQILTCRQCGHVVPPPTPTVVLEELYPVLNANASVLIDRISREQR